MSESADNLKAIVARRLGAEEIEIDHLMHWYGMSDLIEAVGSLHGLEFRKDDGRAEEVGRQLFGAASRFKFMRWLAARDDPYFYSNQYFEETRDGTQIQFQVKRCMEAGLVAKARQFPITVEGERRFLDIDSSRGGPNPVWYLRLPSRLWQIFDIIESVMDPSGSGRAAAVLRLSTAQRREMVGELLGIRDELLGVGPEPEPEPEPVLPFPYNLTPEKRAAHNRHYAVRIIRTKLMEEAHRNGFT